MCQAANSAARDRATLSHSAIARDRKPTELHTTACGNALAPTPDLLFVPSSNAKRVVTTVDRLKEAPVLTVSDAEGFAESGGMIELFQENGRMRFAVNVEVVQRSGLRVSSRVLDLARIVKRDHVQ
jgi:hypothetical protein